MSNIEKLSSSSSLKDLVDRQELLTNNIEEQKNTLKEILISKNVEVADSENKLSILIDKVNELENAVYWLYKDGNEYVDVTGGFKQGGYIRGSSYSMTKNENFIELKASGTSTSTVSFVNNNSIDFSKYSKLKVYSLNTTNNTASSQSVIAIRTSNSTISTSATDILARLILPHNSDKIHEIDISNVNSVGYIQCTADKWDATSVTNIFKIYKIWLER